MLFGVANGQTPIAAFDGTPVSGTAPLTVTLTDQSTGNPTGWAWYFGDETYTGPWTLVNSSAGWLGRIRHTGVVMPDGSIVLMGGSARDGNNKNDVWRSIDKGTTWTLMNASAGWSARWGHTSVVMPDGSIVLMGGWNNTDHILNDVWRSIDEGSTWTLMNASAAWPARLGHTSVVTPDGVIVLMGGENPARYMYNDVWRSMDNGATWTLMNTSAGWTARTMPTSVAMPDGSIVLMGGYEPPRYKNDTWRSTDDGTSWIQANASAGWSARWGHTSVSMMDGSIVLMGGSGYDYYNDTWRSTDNGTTWSQVNASAEWSGRYSPTSVAMPDGSIVLMGGDDVTAIGNYLNDVWRFVPAGSSAQNPSHTYTKPGAYQVALQVYNADGYNSSRKTGYVTVTATPFASFMVNTISGPAPLGVQFTDISTGTAINEWDWSFGDGSWFNTTNVNQKNPFHVYSPNGAYHAQLTVCNNGGCNTTNPNATITVTTPITNKTTKIGVFRPANGNWYLDSTLTGVVNMLFHFGKYGDIPVVGDWNGDGITDTGVFRSSNGNWYLSTNKAGTVDVMFHFGKSGDIPVVGDWDGTGITNVGVFRPGNGNWYLDTTKTGIVNKTFHFGTPGDTPVVGKWI